MELNEKEGDTMGHVLGREVKVVAMTETCFLMKRCHGRSKIRLTRCVSYAEEEGNRPSSLWSPSLKPLKKEEGKHKARNAPGESGQV